jgi:signal transduction histidine kinase
VAHGLTVLVIQSVAARDAIEHGEPPARVLGRLEASEQVARESLAELRVLLGILGGSEDARPLAASTGVAGVRDLVAQFVASGQRVRLEVSGVERPLGAGLAMTVYRVVQESLTNVLKHAGGADTVVSIRFVDGAVEIGVENRPGRPSALADRGAGRGLAGLAERAHLYGGRLTTASTAEGGFRVSCRLPDAAVAVAR